MQPMIYLFPAFALGYLLCFGIVYREYKRLIAQRDEALERIEILHALNRDSAFEVARLEEELEDQKLLFAEHQSRCSVLPDDTPIYVNEVEI
jgi:hypothetical protein